MSAPARAGQAESGRSAAATRAAPGAILAGLLSSRSTRSVPRPLPILVVAGSAWLAAVPPAAGDEVSEAVACGVTHGPRPGRLARQGALAGIGSRGLPDAGDHPGGVRLLLRPATGRGGGRVLPGGRRPGLAAAL